MATAIFGSTGVNWDDHRGWRLFGDSWDARQIPEIGVSRIRPTGEGANRQSLGFPHTGDDQLGIVGGPRPDARPQLPVVGTSRLHGQEE